MAIVAIVIALALGFNLGRQATVVRQLRREEARLEQEVMAEKRRATVLQTREAYVQSDEFIEEWARTVAKLTRPGEARVILLKEGEEERQPFPEPLESTLEARHRLEEESPPYWQQWWELFFGPVPPNPHSELD